MRHIVSFSGGICSFWAAKRVVERYGRENTVLLFADTLIEDPGLYQFNRDVERVLGLKITRIADGRTPWQVFRDNHMIGNTHSDLCSRILKREFIWAWIQGHHFAFGPERAVVHLGMDFSEFNRLADVKAANPDWEITAPMCEEPLWDKPRMIAELKPLGIVPPRLYAFGFPHNNCGGFCVKAGITQFMHLLNVLPDVYAMHEREEILTRRHLKRHNRGSWNFAILRDRRGGKTVPLTLRRLRRRIAAGDTSLPKDEWGGCGCAVDYAPVE